MWPETWLLSSGNRSVTKQGFKTTSLMSLSRCASRGCKKSPRQIIVLATWDIRSKKEGK